MTWTDRAGMFSMAVFGFAGGIVVYGWAMHGARPAPCAPPAAYPTAAEVVVAIARVCPKAWKVTLENGKLEGSCLAR